MMWAGCGQSSTYCLFTEGAFPAGDRPRISDREQCGVGDVVHSRWWLPFCRCLLPHFHQGWPSCWSQPWSESIHIWGQTDWLRVSVCVILERVNMPVTVETAFLVPLLACTTFSPLTFWHHVSFDGRLLTTLSIPLSHTRTCICMSEMYITGFWCSHRWTCRENIFNKH